MRRAAMTLLLSASCTPESPAFVVPEPTDFAYSTALVRVDDDYCGNLAAVGGNGGTAMFDVDNRLEVAIELAKVWPEGCEEIEHVEVDAGETYLVGLIQTGTVLRVKDLDGAILHAWYVDVGSTGGLLVVQ